ncbi:MAG: hypothetical protein AB8F65_03410 [Woeseiaceae bacterium]
MNKVNRRDFLISLIIGIAYYCLHTNLGGVAAAVALPKQFVPFSQHYPSTALLLFSLVTTIPAAAFAAGVAGYAVAKWVPKHQVFWGIAIVIGVTLFSAWRFDLYGSYLANLKFFVIPQDMTFLPMMAAWWLFLPLSVAWFVRRSTRRAR